MEPYDDNISSIFYVIKSIEYSFCVWFLEKKKKRKRKPTVKKHEDDI